MIWGICANSHDVMETSPSAVEIRLCQLGTHVWSSVDMVTRISDSGTQCAGSEGSNDVAIVAASDVMECGEGKKGRFWNRGLSFWLNSTQAPAARVVGSRVYLCLSTKSCR